MQPYYDHTTHGIMTALKAFSFAFLFLSLLLLGCQAEAPVAEYEQPNPAVGFSYYTAPQGGVALSREEMATQAEASAGLMRTFAQATALGDWQAVEQRVRAAAAQESALPAPDREQAAAAFLLDLYLLKGNATPEKQEAIAYHTERLVAHGSPEAARIADALDKLEGYWPEAKRQDLAARAASNATAYLAKRAACDGCSFEQVLEKAGQGAQMQHARSETERAVVRLQSLSQS